MKQESGIGISDMKTFNLDDFPPYLVELIDGCARTLNLPYAKIIETLLYGYFAQKEIKGVHWSVKKDIQDELELGRKLEGEKLYNLLRAHYLDESIYIENIIRFWEIHREVLNLEKLLDEHLSKDPDYINTPEFKSNLQAIKLLMFRFRIIMAPTEHPTYKKFEKDGTIKEFNEWFENKMKVLIEKYGFDE